MKTLEFGPFQAYKFQGMVYMQYIQGCSGENNYEGSSTGSADFSDWSFMTLFCQREQGKEHVLVDVFKCFGVQLFWPLPNK